MTTPIERTEAAWTLMRAAARVMEVAELWLDAIHTAPSAEARDAARQNFERCMAQADRARGKGSRHGLIRFASRDLPCAKELPATSECRNPAPARSVPSHP